MKDIDFDELDKAVTSVLNQSPASNTVADAPNDTTTVVAETVVEDDAQADGGMTNEAVDHADAVESPVVETETPFVEEAMTAPVDEQADEDAVTTVDAPVASLAAKRRGKFMDVVHPSSDMAPGKTVEAANESTQRLVVSPISDDMTSAVDEIAADDSTDDPAPFVTEVPTDSPEPTETETAVGDVTDTPVDGTPEEDGVADTSPATEPEVESPSTPDQQTPFISGAVVEKRPLGTFGDTETDAPAEVTEDTVPSDVEEPVSAAVGPAAAPTQRELQSDIVQVETVTDEADHGEDAAVMAAPVIGSDQTDDAHHLFDTAAYHQPLAATAMTKKKAPLWLWWMIGLLVCLLAGGGVGYILYAGGF